MRRLLLGLLVAAQLPSAGPSAAIADAQARLQANDPAGAVVILEPVVATDPSNVPAWRVLATALQRSKAYQRAMVAFQKILELQPTATQMLYNVGATHALAGSTAQAFEWLERAKATRRVDMSQIDVDGNLASLRDNPRFAALRPVRADFADPFVEPVKILKQWNGEAANDQFGWIARSAGDVDGDRVLDVVTSAPTKDVKGASAGRIYVYSTKSGTRLWTADGAPGDRLGTGLEGAGDTNHDGVPDVIAGAPGGGYARIYSGRDGRVLLTLRAEATSDLFGRHVSHAGDVDHDGYADVVVGAPQNGAGGERAGRAYVYSGKDGRVLLTLTGERAGDAFGSTIAGQTEGKTMLLIVGAPSAGAAKHGRTYVYKDLSAKPAFVIEADDTGNALGAMFVSAPGDVDGDAVPDVYASDFSNTARGPATGRIYVHSGKDGRRLLTLTGETSGDAFGTSPSVAGDVDGDGHADLIVGAWQYAGAAVSGGRAYLHSGKDGRVLKTFTCRTPGDTLGFDAVGLGDVDEDGTIDLLLTSAWSGINGYHSGRMFVVSSGVAPRSRVEAVAQGIDQPSALAFLPDGTGLIASRRRAELHLLDVRSGDVQPLESPLKVLTGEDAGIHDVILHPRYSTNGWIYVAYSEGTPERSTTVVDRMRLRGRSLTEAHRVFTADAYAEDRFHYGGRLAFVADHLFVTIGDRHHQDRAQDLTHHFGAIVRLFDDGGTPADNPFVGRERARPEIWTYGHRHPQGIALHPETGDVWFHEHGPLGGDELNVLRRGANYGWPVVSYGWEYTGGPIGKGIVADKGIEDPVWVWSKAIAPSGALFYTGQRFPAWRGSLFIGAMAGRHVNRLVIDRERVVLEERLLLGQAGRVRMVQQAPDGALYIGDDDGRIWRLVAGDAP